MHGHCPPKQALHTRTRGATINFSQARPTVQLKGYETAPYLIQLSQDMTSDCLFTFVFSPFLPEFTCFVPKIVLNIKTKQFLARNR
jgi:hypothetical protein